MTPRWKRFVDWFFGVRKVDVAVASFLLGCAFVSGSAIVLRMFFPETGAYPWFFLLYPILFVTLALVHIQSIHNKMNDDD